MDNITKNQTGGISPQKTALIEVLTQPKTRVKLLQVASHIVGSEGAEDVIQDALLYISLKPVSKFDKVRDAFPYAKKMVTRRAEAQKIRLKKRKMVAEVGGFFPQAGDFVGSVIRNWNLSIDLPNFLGKLDAEDVKIILLKTHGYSHEEIAELMGLPSEEASRKMLQRARAAFIKLYQEFDPDHDPKGGGRKIKSRQKNGPKVDIFSSKPKSDRKDKNGLSRSRLFYLVSIREVFVLHYLNKRNDKNELLIIFDIEFKKKNLLNCVNPYKDFGIKDIDSGFCFNSSGFLMNSKFLRLQYGTGDVKKVLNSPDNQILFSFLDNLN